MKKIANLIFNRNFILITAVVLGLSIGDFAVYTKKYTLLSLAVVMVFSLTGISMKDMLPVKRSLKIMFSSVILTYLVSTILILVLSYLILDKRSLIYGMVVIAASPPGIAVIPFSFILKGDMNYALIGTFGSYAGAIFLAPLIIFIFTGGSIPILSIFIVMVKIIIIPLLVSRLLVLKKVLPFIEKVRGKIIDFGFALIIFTAVGLNKRVFFSHFDILLKITLILIVITFGVGLLYESVARKMSFSRSIVTTQTLFMTVKSSGFTAATSLALFGRDAAVPSAVLSVVILAYLLFMTIRSDIKNI